MSPAPTVSMAMRWPAGTCTAVGRLLWLKAGAAGELIEPQAVRAAAVPNRARVVKEVRIVGMALPRLRVENQGALRRSKGGRGTCHSSVRSHRHTGFKKFQIFLKWPETIGFGRVSNLPARGCVFVSDKRCAASKAPGHSDPCAQPAGIPHIWCMIPSTQTARNSWNSSTVVHAGRQGPQSLVPPHLVQAVWPGAAHRRGGECRRCPAGGVCLHLVRCGQLPRLAEPAPGLDGARSCAAGPWTPCANARPTAQA